MATAYLIDGKEAQGEDYAGAIEALPAEDLDCVYFGRAGKGALMVSTAPGGFSVTEQRADGSSWLSPVLTRDQAKNLVRLFLDGGDYWREGVEWESQTLTTRDVVRRVCWLALIGAVVVAVTLWMVKFFSRDSM